MNYNLTLSEQHLAVIDRALQEAPFKFAAPVVAAINEQIVAQQKQAAEPRVEKEPHVG